MTFTAATAVPAVPAAVTAAAAAPVGETQYFDRPEGRLAYSVVGDGPLVVLVPGLGDVRGEYRTLAPALAGAGFRAVSLDLRGHGESSTRWSRYTAAAVGEDVVALIRHLDAGPAYVVGTSLGAGAGAWAAADAPELIAGLVLIGPFVRDVPPPSPWQGSLQQALIKVLFARPWGPTAWGAYYASLYTGGPPADFRAYRADLVANLRQPGRLEAMQAMLRASKRDVEARLGQVRAPVLVVMGSRDPDFPDPAAEAHLVAERLRGSVVLIEGAGHYPHVQHPAATNPQIVAFLDGLRLRPSTTAGTIDGASAGGAS